MDSIVALDIETTGLDAQKDAIIEIGAVRFHGGRVEDEWSTLVNPGQRIPPFITQLTGITDQMVLTAPRIQEVVQDLADFIGDLPILGHNIRFDLSFLRRQGIFAHNELLDTYEMAAVLLPGASRYNLASLTQLLNVPYPATHRALEDARATRGIFLRLFDLALQLPLDILADIVRLGEDVEWNGYGAFHRALKQRSRERVIGTVGIRARFEQGRPAEGVAAVIPLAEPAHPSPLDIDEVAALLEPGGVFARHFPQFEYRPQQVEMLRAVARALSEQRHLMVEAGTGTGKSMAYLIPAALWALQNQQRVVISTNTINLQDQLINKDIPDLCQALDLDLKAVVLKGRANYLCPRRLESFLKRGPQSADELRVLAKVLVWLSMSHSGDRTEINLNGPVERSIWLRLSAEDDDCTGDTCIRRMGGICPFYRARQAALGAHLLIVNHALLLSDVAANHRVLPDYRYLILDEAHHLEDATTNALSFHITLSEVERLLRNAGGPSGGVLGWLLSALTGLLHPGDYAAAYELVQRATDLLIRLESQLREFFSTIDSFLSEQREDRPMGMYAHQERIVSATRSQPAWGAVEIAWDEATRTLAPLLEIFKKLTEGLAEVRENLEEEDEELYSTLTSLYRGFSEFYENVEALVMHPKEGMVYWAETQPNNYHVSLHAAPLYIGDLMQRHLWHNKDCVILTSATLTTAGEFSYLRGRLNAMEADELALGSPFDYESAALVYLINDIPEPSDRQGHQRAVESGLIQLCKATGGRTLALFTSYDQLKRTAQAISPVLAKENILVYEQGEGASAHSLLETFRSTERAVLLGTRSFWEGIDVPGEALSVLALIKLPFDVPSDPIIAARAETFEDPFNEYSLHEAILRFRQGFGRLIRTQYDRGVVAVFDRRILSKQYGRLFLASLPQCTVRTGSLADLPRTAARWLNL